MLGRLQKLGLSEKESQIYIALVKLGEASANQLAKHSSTNRTVTYNVLQQLMEKGLVAYVKKDRKRVFLLSKPESLLTNLKEKEIIAEGLIDEIKKTAVMSYSFRSVEVYEGIEGMKVVFDEIRNAKNLRVLNATGRIFEYLKYGAGHIVKDIEIHGNARVIANQSVKRTPLSKSKVKFKYLPAEAENYATTFIFNNKVVIQVLKDKPFLIKIENREIFEGYKKDFDVFWEKI